MAFDSLEVIREAELEIQDETKISITTLDQLPFTIRRNCNE